MNFPICFAMCISPISLIWICVGHQRLVLQRKSSVSVFCSIIVRSSPLCWSSTFHFILLCPALPYSSLLSFFSCLLKSTPLCPFLSIAVQLHYIPFSSIPPRLMTLQSASLCAALYWSAPLYFTQHYLTLYLDAHICNGATVPLNIDWGCGVVVSRSFSIWEAVGSRPQRVHCSRQRLLECKSVWYPYQFLKR